MYFFDTCVHECYILRLLKCLLDHVVPHWKPSNSLPLSFSFSYLEITCSPCAHHSRHRVPCSCSKKKKNKKQTNKQKKFAHISLCTWTSFSSSNTFLLACHITIFLVLQLQINCTFLRDVFLDTHSIWKAPSNYSTLPYIFPS